MITKLVKRYYCEHCGKGGQTKAIANHEESCIKNPERKCWACKEFGLEQLPMPELRKAFQDGGTYAVGEITICPACKLAALMQERKANPSAWDDEDEYFDYKAEMSEMYKEKMRNPYEIP